MPTVRQKKRRMKQNDRRLKSLYSRFHFLNWAGEGKLVKSAFSGSMPSEDTIVAIATPPGRGAIGMVRLSGARAIEIAVKLVRLAKPELETQRATLGELYEPESGRVLDQVVVTCFRAPHSYTAEDVVEIACHGAPVILTYAVERSLALGARPA